MFKIISIHYTVGQERRATIRGKRWSVGGAVEEIHIVLTILCRLKLLKYSVGKGNYFHLYNYSFQILNKHSIGLSIKMCSKFALFTGAVSQDSFNHEYQSISPPTNTVHI